MRLACFFLVIFSACAARVGPASPLHVARTAVQLQAFYGKLCTSGKVEVLSMQPLVLYLRGFVSKDVCKALIATAEAEGLQRYKHIFMYTCTLHVMSLVIRFAR
jgi:hypothetical protein